MARWLVVLFLYVQAESVSAHARNNAFIELVQTPGKLAGALQLRLEDLPLIVAIDADRNNELTWGEVQHSRNAIADYITERLKLSYGEDKCTLVLGEFQIQYLAGGNYLYIPMDGVCPLAGIRLDIEYSLLFERDAAHRGLMKLQAGNAPVLFVFSPGQQNFSIENGEQSTLLYMLTFLEEGVWHIWTGYDHLLFLLALLVPLFGTKKTLLNSSDIKFRPVAIRVLKLVTAFTVAHSITLIATSIYQPAFNPAVVETLIAGSVVVAGINILWPIFDKGHWRIAFGFGLLHGLGFASALSGLVLPTNYFLQCLLSFNLGVELGQLAIVLPCIPLLLLLSRLSSYQSRVLPALAVLIVSCSLWWTIERGMQL